MSAFAERVGNIPPSVGLIEPIAPAVSPDTQGNRRRGIKEVAKRTLATAALTVTGFLGGIVPAAAESNQPVPASPGISSPQPSLPKIESPRPQLIITEHRTAPEPQSSAEIFGALAETWPEVQQNPRTVGGFSLYVDTSGEITALLANAKTSTGEFTTSISVRQVNGTFTQFQPLWTAPPNMEPFSVLERTDGSISVGGNITIPPGVPVYYTSRDGGATWVSESVPTPHGEMSEQQQLKDVTIINDVGVLIMRYADGKQKVVTGINDARSSLTAIRINNQVIAYITTYNYGMKKITIDDIYNPHATTQNTSLGGTSDALTVKWGANDAEKIYVAVAGPQALRTLDASGNPLSGDISFSQLGLDDVYSMRLVGKNRLLVGGEWNGETVLVLRDLTKPITDSTATKRITVASGVETAIIYQRNMQVGEIGGRTFVMTYLSEYGLTVQEIDTANGTFIGSPMWIVGGLGEEKPPPVYKVNLPIIRN
jgi:hypothetical protein